MLFSNVGIYLDLVGENSHVPVTCINNQEIVFFVLHVLINYFDILKFNKIRPLTFCCLVFLYHHFKFYNVYKEVVGSRFLSLSSKPYCL